MVGVWCVCVVCVWVCGVCVWGVEVWVCGCVCVDVWICGCVGGCVGVCVCGCACVVSLCEPTRKEPELTQADKRMHRHSYVCVVCGVVCVCM